MHSAVVLEPIHNALLSRINRNMWATSWPSVWRRPSRHSCSRCARDGQGLVAALRRRIAALRALTVPARSARTCSYVMAVRIRVRSSRLQRSCTTMSVTSCSNGIDGRIFSEAVFAPLFLSACARHRDVARDRAPESTGGGFHTGSIEALHTGTRCASLTFVLPKEVSPPPSVRSSFCRSGPPACCEHVRQA
jgi:hypothetical protein